MRIRGSRGCTGSAWFRMAGCSLLVLALVNCGAPAESRAPVAAPLIVHDGLEPRDRIDGLDLAMEPGGIVHLVWRESLGLYGGSSTRQRIMYRRGRGDPVRWDRPMLVTGSAVGIPQVIVRDDGVHVLAGVRLEHWRLPTGADRWQKQGELLDPDAPAATAFDAGTVGDGTVVVYSSGGMAGEQVVYGLRWQGEAPGEPVPVARYPVAPGAAVNLTAPVLLSRPGRPLVLWGAHVLVEVPKGAYTEFHDEGRVYAAWSTDAGRHWTRPETVNADAAAQTSLHDIAATDAGPGPLALFAAHGLFASRWRSGAWSSPRRLAGYDIAGELSGSAKTFHVTATQCAGQPLVAWVDGRHQRSDKRWWNPLGGFPWSDSPDWINNDLFVLAGDRLAAALDGQPVQPQRQTSPGSYTQGVAVVDRGDHALLLWAGRARVQKSPDDMGAPPMILQRRIECG